MPINATLPASHPKVTCVGRITRAGGRITVRVRNTRGSVLTATRTVTRETWSQQEEQRLIDIGEKMLKFWDQACDTQSIPTVGFNEEPISPSGDYRGR
jgi:hypothetical protein